MRAGFGWCHNPPSPRVEMLSAGLYNWTEEVVVEEEDTYVYYEGGDTQEVLVRLCSLPTCVLPNALEIWSTTACRHSWT